MGRAEQLVADHEFLHGRRAKQRREIMGVKMIVGVRFAVGRALRKPIE